MSVNKVRQKGAPMEKRRIHISSKRQITIPSKYYNALGLTNEINCIYANNMLILTPVNNEDPAFAEEMLSDLIEQGYSGQKLLSEFKRLSRQIRPAVEKIIQEADTIAREASINYFDSTDEIFGPDDDMEG
jgi:bifunctional DNA-binding transcriptional regulator/antitoxin component of YhaV-PrlF toxin-antitoxin module